MSLVVAAIVSAAADAVEAAGVTPVYERRMGALDGREGAVVRIGPQGVVTQYINGQADVEQPVRVLCKRRGVTEAMADAEKVWDALDGLRVTAGATEVTVTATRTPMELSMDDSGYSIWEVDATARYRTDGQP